MFKKYGPNAVKNFGNPNSNLYRAGRKVGINFNPERSVYPTVLPHTLMEYLKNVDNEKANQLMNELYEQYFEQACKVNSQEVLTGILQGIFGNDSDEIEKAINAMKDEGLQQEVISKDKKAKNEMNVHGVPFFIIEKNDGSNSIKFSGAQPSDIIAEQLEIAAEEA